MIAPSGTGHSHRPPERNDITRSHGRKLLAVWIAAVALLVILILTTTQNERRFFLGVWLVLSLPLAILTVIWWRERDHR